MKKLEVKDENYCIGRGYGNTSKTDDDHSTEHDGFVLTKYGFVKVYSNIYKTHKKDQWTFIEIIKDRRLYVRRFNRFYSTRFLVTLAKRFAEDIFENR